METHILNAALNSERTLWNFTLEQIGAYRRDVYFRPDYMLPYSRRADKDACCYVFKDNDAVLMYPFMKNQIIRKTGKNDQILLHDIESAYGYGGPVVNCAGEDTGFLQQAWGNFANWCIAEHIVSEFVRFHPLIENIRWAPQAMKKLKDRLTVQIILKSYESDLNKSSYYRTHRQMLSKARRSGYSFHVLPAKSELSWFVPLYLETQKSLGAKESLNYGIEYFETLTEGLDSSVWLGVVKLFGEISGAALVLESSVYVHSHLMGYRRDIPSNGMTNLLYHGIAVEGVQRGKQVLHMGGGVSSGEDDPLFRFKKDLSPARAEFWLGTTCHDVTQYELLSRDWELANGTRPGNYLQFYRLETSKD